MSYIGDSINASPTIAERAGAAIPGGAGLVVKYDANGCIVPCATAGEPALGVIIMQQGDVTVGDSVTVQIKDVATCVSGGAVSKGALVAVNASAQAVAAEAGDFAIGMALSGASAAGQMVQVQICKCGFVPEAKE